LYKCAIPGVVEQGARLRQASGGQSRGQGAGGRGEDTRYEFKDTSGLCRDEITCILNSLKLTQTHSNSLIFAFVFPASEALGAKEDACFFHSFFFYYLYHTK